MSKRSIRKVRHYNPGPSFKEKVHAGMLKKQLSMKKVSSSPIVSTLTKESGSEEHHVHDEACNHEHGEE